MLYVRCVQVIRWEKDEIFIENSMEKEKASKGSIGDLILFYISKLSIGVVLWRGTRNMCQGCLDCFEEMKFQKWEKNPSLNTSQRSSLHLLTLSRKFRLQVPTRSGGSRKFRLWTGSSGSPASSPLGSWNLSIPEVPTLTRKFRLCWFPCVKFKFCHLSGSSESQPEVPKHTEYTQRLVLRGDPINTPSPLPLKAAAPTYEKHILEPPKHLSHSILGLS